MKTSLDLRAAPTALNGETLGKDTLAQIAATAMMQQSEGDAIKLYSISMELFKAGTVTLDRSDLDAVRNSIDASKLINLVKAQIAEKIDDSIAKLREKKDE
jgi:hypothetical protein